MAPLLAALLCLTGPVAAQTSFERPLAAAAAAASDSAARLRDRPREVACAVEADRPIEAVNQISGLAPDRRFPVRITRASPRRVEIRAQALPLGFRPADNVPSIAKAAGVMVREIGGGEFWLVGLDFKEFHGGGRWLHAWQVVSTGGEEAKSLDADLAKAPSGAFEAVIPSKSGDARVKVSCSVSPAPAN